MSITERQQALLAAQRAEHRNEQAVHALEEAAYLRFKGHTLRRMERGSNDKAVFIFLASQALYQARKDWLSGHALVDARLFARELRDTRNRALYLRNSGREVWVADSDAGDSEHGYVA